MVPSLGALDKGNTQWLFLSFVPLMFIKNLKHINLYNKIIYIYAFFILQCIISLVYTNNINVSIIDLSRHLILFLLVTLLVSLLKNNKFTFYRISVVISLFLLYESTASLSPLFHFIYNNGLDFSLISSINIDSLKGVTGNRNITTASIVIKLPFVIYSIYYSKPFFKIVFGILLFFPSLSLLIINSRAALLSLILILLILILTVLVNHFKKSLNLLFIVIPITLSILFANSLVPDKSLNTAQRIESIEFSNESSSQRFFLWENAFDYISKNPFIGCGIGNWKIESAAYWGSYGDRYLVPFHAHNDFIEFTTELGIMGGLTYLFLFLFVLYKSLVQYIKTRDLKFLILLLSLTALFIDSSLNFPFERPIIQVMFVVLIALNINYDADE